MLKETYTKSLKYYLIFTFLLTFGMGFIIYSLGGLDEYPAFSSFIMIFPAIVAIIVTGTLEKNIGFPSMLKSLGLRLGKVKYLIIYPIITFILIIFIYLFTYLIAPDIYVPASDLPEILSGLSIEFGSLSIPLQIISIFLLNCFIAAIINIPLMLGEEIGWRAFLYPRLESIYPRSGLIIGGIIWGVWHAPMILMGLNYPSTPFLGVFMMTLFCIPFGIILYYFYRKSGSIITVALCHGVLNKTASTVQMIFVDNEKMQPVIHGPMGIIGIVIFALFSFVLYRNYIMKNYNQIALIK